MSRQSWMLSLTAICLLAPSVSSANDAELARTKNCTACHAVDRKLIGPSFKEIAARYGGDKSAAAKLVQKVRQGGAGVWGPVPMPANPQVNDAEAATLVNWVLSQK